jgi:uncharacterized protein (UPF0264 family)
VTGLLVSVRSAAEAQVALSAGVDLIDVKEPSRGSLGAADTAVCEEVLGVVGGRRPVSVALGELLDEAERVNSPAGPAGPSWRAGCIPSFAKLGLAGAAALADWQARWTAAMHALPEGVQPVAVTYADWQGACAPPPLAVLAAAAAMDARTLLVDTHDKSHGNLLTHLTWSELTELSARAAAVNIRLVLAGSLDAEAIRAVLPLAPAYVAVRGAACAGSRTQAIDAARVKRLVELVRTTV